MFVTFHELCDEFQANLSQSETPNFKNKKADITIWADLLYFTHSQMEKQTQNAKLNQLIHISEHLQSSLVDVLELWEVT